MQNPLHLKQALQLKRAVRLVWTGSPRWTTANVALVVAQGLLPLVTLYLMKLITDAVALGIASADKEHAFRQTLVLIAVAGGVALAGALLGVLAAYVSEGQAQSVSDYMSCILQAKTTAADLEYYENSEYQNTLHRAQEEAPFRPAKIVQGLTQLGQNLVALISIGVLLFLLHPGIILVLAAAAIPGIVVRLKFIKAMFEWQRSRTLAERRSNYFNWILTQSYCAKEVRLFGLGELFMNRFRLLRDSIRRQRLTIAARRARADLGTQSFAILPMFGCLAFVVYRAFHGQVSVGGVVMYFQAFQRGQSALQSVLAAGLGLHEDNMFLSNLYEFLDLEPKILEPADPQPVPRQLTGGIVFENVSFSYPSSTRAALHDVSLHIGAGEVVALVGENGSGKTTLIKLLCRLYDPTAGRVLLDDRDLCEFRTADLRRQISVIFQDYMQYDMTARENIWMGNVTLPEDSPLIVAAASQSGADEVIAGLPETYDTMLGHIFEGGEQLSVGQWQKVAIARAFVRDSQILILDEPTSALDPKAEYEVFANFRKLIKGQTAILISHRLSTVRMADRICVMEDGTIVEHGTHDELMSRGGRYAHLFETQAEAYR